MDSIEKTLSAVELEPIAIEMHFMHQSIHQK